jgi:hypothetical protein
VAVVAPVARRAHAAWRRVLEREPPLAPPPRYSPRAAPRARASRADYCFPSSAPAATFAFPSSRASARISPCPDRRLRGSATPLGGRFRLLRAGRSPPGWGSEAALCRVSRPSSSASAFSSASAGGCWRGFSRFVSLWRDPRGTGPSPGGRPCRGSPAGRSPPAVNGARRVMGPYGTGSSVRASMKSSRSSRRKSTKNAAKPLARPAGHAERQPALPDEETASVSMVVPIA